ncbi:MAG: alpha-glucan family phosphorylase [Acidimicrobiia bacterium]
MDQQSIREGLLRLAANHRWTWAVSARSLLDSLPGTAPGRHPYQVVTTLGEAQMEALEGDPRFVERLGAELTDLDAVLDGARPATIAYCSPEFGIAARLPQYSGGLGVLAGDHLKAASDAGLPLVGVGLFYREGFFRQVIDGGVQSERYVTLDPDSLGARDTGVEVTVPLPGRDVAARVWTLEVGRTTLVLLDTDLDGNEADRAITDRLYSGDRRHRLEQEMVLGVGGARALEALGIEVTVYHLNEGHAGFITLELIDRLINGGDLEGAMESVRSSLVFTTHTPVPAGIDKFSHELIAPYLALWSRRWGVDFDDIWGIGVDPEDDDEFNMAALALRLCRSANGVSRLHGEVSRSLFAGVGIGDDITHVTNGVHARTWVGDEAQYLYDEVAGRAWEAGDERAWARISELGTGQIGTLRHSAAVRLGERVREATGHEVNPESLIIGFARRFAPYKRATLLLERREELEALLENSERPVHFLFAGKAHPMDVPGKQQLADIVAYAEERGPKGGFTLIPDYDMEIAGALVEGCDVWLNTPIRPREASGTSGQKAALNGALNCSILDGWWAEMFDGQNGWAIPESEGPEGRNRFESASTLEVIAEIAATYYTDRASFVDRIRHSWKTLGPKVTAARMLQDYEREIYLTR